jgi:hypothetical protein
MNCDVYLRSHTVYIPTMGMMEKGFYRGVEPVAVVSTSDTERLKQALRAAIARGNPPVPMLMRRDWPPPILLKYANVKSWSAFERGMQFWTIQQKDGTFRIAGQRKQHDQMWRDDPEHVIAFSPATTTDEVIDRMIAILQAAASQQ